MIRIAIAFGMAFFATDMLADRSSHQRATIGVAARVLPVARIVSVRAPPTVDVRDGAVVIHMLELTVSGNSGEGYRLELLPRSDWVARAELVGYGPAFDVEGGAIVTRRWRDGRNDHMRVAVRFWPADGLPAGSYPFPLELRVIPF